MRFFLLLFLTTPSFADAAARRVLRSTPHATRVVRLRAAAAEPEPTEGEDLSVEWSRFARDVTFESAAQGLASAQLDPKRRQLWEQLRRDAELDAVKTASATLRRNAPADADTPEWQRLCLALGELQYWLITTGNNDAESVMLDTIQRFHLKERWIAVEADGLLRKAWSVSSDLSINLRMEAARSLLRAGQAQAAAKAFATIAEECKPPWAEAYRWRAKVCHLALGDVERALENYEVALAYAPRNYPVLFELGALLVKDAAVEALGGGPRSRGSAERAARGVEVLGRAVELCPLLEDKVTTLLAESEEF